MLRAISHQSMLSIITNAVIRGVIFTAILQLVSYASSTQLSSPTQLLVLVLVFGFIVFSVDIVERAWAQHDLKKRG